MDDNNNIKKAPNIPPFLRYCSAIIPTAFDDSLSYYEALCALYNFLQTQVVTAINNNATVTEEYIQMTKDMKSYMDNYFKNLDVQQEINDKLDKMAESGELGQIISTYVQPTITAIQGQIDGVESDVADLKRAYGTPLTASSTDDMTDTTKIYVNTTDGKWYYYDSDSSDWVAGGVYQSVAVNSGSIDLGKFSSGLQESYEAGADWQVGSLTSSGGMTNNTNRVRFSKKMYLKKGSIIKWTSTEGVNWTWESWYSLDNLDVRDNAGWLTSTEVVVPYDGYFALCARYTDNRECTQSDADTLGATLKVYSSIPNYAGQMVSWYCAASTSPVEFNEHVVVEGNNQYLNVILNDEGGIYLTGENGIEFYTLQTWTTQRRTYSMRAKIGNLGDYGTAQYSAAGRLNINIVIPNNYMVVLNTINGSIEVKHVGECLSNYLVLVRNNLGRANCGAFVQIRDYYRLRNISSYEADIDTIASLAYYNPNVESINHRGYNSVAPENTLPAFKMSRQKGFHAVECDVQFTSDGVPVILHDATIDRTSNGTGAIADMTYDQAYQYDFGSWKSPVYAGTHIPTLEQFLALCKHIGLKAYIELKQDVTYTTAQAGLILQLINDYAMHDNVKIISASFTNLNTVLALDNKISLGYVASNINSTVISNTTALKTVYNDVFIDANYTILNDTTLGLVKTAELPLEVWTIDNTTALDSLSSYIRGYTSNSLNVGKYFYEQNI